MRVYLVRHGQAKPPTLDPQRGLTDKGVAEIEKIADLLRPQQLGLEAIWHSGKTRARQTAELLAAAISARQGLIEQAGLAPGDPPEHLSRAIERQAGDLMIVAHQPLVGKVAGLLLTGDARGLAVEVATGSVICLDRAQDAGAWHLEWMLVPDLLEV